MRSRPKRSNATARSVDGRAVCSPPSRPTNSTWRRRATTSPTYTFGRHVIRHQFCKTCGCAPFSEGTGPDGEAMVAINLRCAENLDLSTLKIAQFDGASL
jgi:hypothetical protein